MKKTNKFNGWGIQIIKTFIPPVRYFSDALSERLLPAFSNLDTETKQKYQQFLGDYHPKRAEVEANTWHVCMSDVRQSVVNLHAVGLRHLFEQQFCWLVSQLFDDRRRKADYKDDKKALIESGISIEAFRAWEKLEELEHVCNTVKHAEGRATKKLEELRPDLFRNPLLFEAGFPDINFSGKRLPVHHPLSGDDIYLQETDIKDYALAIEDFWNEFIEQLDQDKVP